MRLELADFVDFNEQGMIESYSVDTIKGFTNYARFFLSIMPEIKDIYWDKECTFLIVKTKDKEIKVNNCCLFDSDFLTESIVCCACNEVKINSKNKLYIDKDTIFKVEPLDFSFLEYNKLELLEQMLYFLGDMDSAIIKQLAEINVFNLNKL